VPASFASARIWGQPPAVIDNLGQSSVPSQFHGNSKVTKAYIAAQTILQDTWDDSGDLGLRGFLTIYYWRPSLVKTTDPRLLQAKAFKYNNDNPN